jgi:hypothetical protein
MPHQTGSADHEGTRPAAAALARSTFSAHYAQTGPTAAVRRLHHVRAACAGESSEKAVGCLKKCMTNSKADSDAGAQQQYTLTDPIAQTQLKPVCK